MTFTLNDVAALLATAERGYAEATLAGDDASAFTYAMAYNAYLRTLESRVWPELTP